MVETTLCFVISDGSVLLAYKKRGFGAGKWNGPGGKIRRGETPLQAVCREMAEEVGIVPYDCVNIGYIDFIHPPHLSEKNTRCHIFTAASYVGSIAESEECLPQWFAINEMPYEAMWDDDRYWYPEMFAGRQIQKEILFDESEKIITIKDI